jgi:hypothetical protein
MITLYWVTHTTPRWRERLDPHSKTYFVSSWGEAHTRAQQLISQGDTRLQIEIGCLQVVQEDLLRILNSTEAKMGAEYFTSIRVSETITHDGERWVSRSTPTPRFWIEYSPVFPHNTQVVLDPTEEIEMGVLVSHGWTFDEETGYYFKHNLDGGVGLERLQDEARFLIKYKR